MIPCFVKSWSASDSNQKKELFQEVPLADISGIARHMGKDLELAEMSSNELAFLCGLLR